MPGLLTSLKSWLPTREVPRAPTKEEIKAVAVETVQGLKESFGLLNQIGTVVNQFMDPYGGIYFNTNQPGGAMAGMRDQKRYGRDRYLYWTEEQLTWFRNYCRWISKTVPFAIGLFGHMVNFTVKTGYQVEVEPSEDAEEEVADEKRLAMKRRIKAFQKRFEEESGGVIHWTSWERMNKAKAHVDGELIWRLYPTPEGMMLRRVEPEQVKNPPGGNETNGWYYGVKCVEGDAFKRLGYWITNEPGTAEGKYVDAEYVIHYRRNADDLTARGVSDLLPCADDMVQVDVLMEAFRKGATERSKIAYIRVHKEMTGQQISEMAAALNEADVVNRITGRPEKAEHTEPGTKIDCADWTNVITMPTGNTEEAIAALEACLRGLSIRWGMPEFITTSDASNANYSSTMIAGGPAVRMFETEQAEDGCNYELLYRKVLRWDALLGEHGFTEEDVDNVEIKVYGPSPVIVDEKAQAEKFQIENQNKVRSKSDWQRQVGLDPEIMREEIAEEEELYPEADPLADGGMGGGGAGGKDEPAANEFDVSLESFMEGYDNSKHPRGQPDNAGQFASGGGGGSTAAGASGTRTTRNINDIAKKGYANVRDHLTDFAQDLHRTADSMSASDLGNYLGGIKAELEGMAKSARVPTTHDGPLDVDVTPDAPKATNRQGKIRAFNQMLTDVKDHLRDYASDLVICAKRKEPIDMSGYLDGIAHSMANAAAAAGVSMKGKHVIEQKR